MGSEYGILFDVSNLVAGVFSLALLVVWSINRNTPGLQAWLMTFCCFAASTLLWTENWPLSSFLAYMLMVTGTAFLWHGARLFHGMPGLTPSRWGISVGLALIGNILFSLYYRAEAASYLFSLVVISYCAFGAAYALLLPRKRLNTASILFGGIALLAGGTGVIKLVYFSTLLRAGIPINLLAEKADAFMYLTTFTGMIGLCSLLAVCEHISRQLQIQADTDAITGLYNRRAFVLAGRKALHQCVRRGADVAVIRMEIDHYREIGDRFDFATADAIQRSFAALLRSSFRAQDVLGRFDSGDYCILMPQTNENAARATTDRILKSLSKSSIRLPDNTAVTASIGVVSVHSGTCSLATLEALVKQAQLALLQAQKRGRNHVEFNKPLQTNEAA